MRHPAGPGPPPHHASAASEGSIGLRLIREHSTEAYLKKTKKSPKNGPENRTAIWHHFLRQRYRYKLFRCRQQEHDCAASLQAAISTKVVGRLAADYAMQKWLCPTHLVKAGRGEAVLWRGCGRADGSNLCIRVAEWPTVPWRERHSSFVQQGGWFWGPRVSIFLTAGSEKRTRFGCQIPDPKLGPQSSTL